jgi:hypothetical protein
MLKEVAGHGDAVQGAPWRLAPVVESKEPVKQLLAGLRFDWAAALRTGGHSGHATDCFGADLGLQEDLLASSRRVSHLVRSRSN